MLFIVPDKDIQDRYKKQEMKNAVTFITGTAAALLLAVCVIIVMVSDREAPQISIQPMDISYAEGDDEKLLIQGVSAYDGRDGDVTDSVLVKDVVPLSNGTQAKVVYVARDKANNISEDYRVVSYTKPEEPDGRLLMPLEELYPAEDVQQDIEDTEAGEETGPEDTEAADDIETPGEEKAGAETEPEPQPEQPAEEKKEEKKAEEKPAAKPADNKNKDPKITLKQSSITLKPGQTIDPMSMIKSKTNVTNVTVAGNVNLSVPGTYNMIYTATGADNKTATANLKIVVE